MATLKTWLAAATAAEKAAMAELARTSVSYLYQVARPDLVKAPKLDLALRITAASKYLEREGLPSIKLEELVNTTDNQ